MDIANSYSIQEKNEFKNTNQRKGYHAEAKMNRNRKGGLSHKRQKKQEKPTNLGDMYHEDMNDLIGFDMKESVFGETIHEPLEEVSYEPITESYRPVYKKLEPEYKVYNVHASEKPYAMKKEKLEDSFPLSLRKELSTVRMPIEDEVHYKKAPRKEIYDDMSKMRFKEVPAKRIKRMPDKVTERDTRSQEEKINDILLQVSEGKISDEQANYMINLVLEPESEGEGGGGGGGMEEYPEGEGGEEGDDENDRFEEYMNSGQNIVGDKDTEEEPEEDMGTTKGKPKESTEKHAEDSPREMRVFEATEDWNSSYAGEKMGRIVETHAKGPRDESHRKYRLEEISRREEGDNINLEQLHELKVWNIEELLNTLD